VGSLSADSVRPVPGDRNRPHPLAAIIRRIEIRPADQSDAETLAEIQRAASLAALAHIFPPDRYPFPLEEVRGRWREAVADPGIRVVVAEEGGRALGLAGVRRDWLDGLYVVPEAWGSGLGRDLHDHALSLVADLGSRRCHLWVLEHNERARRFYERLGWRENGDTRVVPFPPNPIDVGYTIDLDSRMAAG
jgi:RimJ/RimL family protein N-acetyltransferase